MKQGAAAGAALQFSQGHSCPQRKLAKRKRTSLCTIHFPGLRRFRGAVTPPLAPGVCACGAVCKHSDRVLWQAHRSASCGRSSEVCLAQRSEFSSALRGAPKIQGTARGRNRELCLAAQPRRCLRQKQPRRSRGKHSDRVQWTKQGAVFGAVLQFLQGHSCPQEKLAKRKRTAVCFLRGRDDARSKNRAPQPGAALRFLQAPALARRKNRLSARGTNGDRVLRTK